MAKPKAFKVGLTAQLGENSKIKMTITRLFLKDENIEEVEVAYYNKNDELQRERLPKDALKVL